MSERPASPYKGLAAFADSAVDALLFFGRERERQTIVANLLASKLTVLYGPSGVGKSSLLRAGVAQELRRQDAGAVVVHGSWTDDPVSSLVASIRHECPELGPTAGLADAVAAAAQARGEALLLLDQFEEYFLYHGEDGPLAAELPALLRRPGLRVSVLVALRDDALAELDAFTGRIAGLFANMLRLDRLDRGAAREAIVGPLARYGELVGREYAAEPELVDAVLDEVAEGRVDFTGAADPTATREHVETPFLQLVLERLWAEEQAAGSHVLRLETFRRLGGAEPIVREHVQGALERLPAADQVGAARVVRQLVTSSGAKVAHTASDLAEYASIDGVELQPLLETLMRERIVRGVDGTPGRPIRYEIFHDILAAPVLEWRVRFEVERERIAARRQRRRLRAIVAVSLAALLVVGAIAVYAFVQRSDARTAARHAHGRELAADALARLPSNPSAGVALALRAAGLAPGTQTEDVLRSSLLAMREERVLRVGGHVVAASFAPRGGRLLVASDDGRVAMYDTGGRLLYRLPRGGRTTHAAWNGAGTLFATGDADGEVDVRDATNGRLVRRISTPAPISVLAFAGNVLLAGSGGHIHIVVSTIRTIRIQGAVVAAALSGDRLAYAAAKGGRVTTKIYDLRSRRVIRTLPERGIGSLVFSANGKLLVTGSTDRTARVWRAATGRLAHVLPMRGDVVSEQFSADGTMLVTASTDGTAALWTLRTGERELLLTGATGAAEDAAFSPDGKEIAVAFADRVARVYSTQDGRLLAPLAGHGDAVTSVAFDPSGRSIVTGGADGTARIWDANPSGQLTTIDTRKTPVDALFAGDAVLSVAGREARELTAGGRPLGTLRMPRPIVAAATHGHEVALADSAGDLDTGRLARGAGVTAVAYTPAGTLVTGSRSGTVTIWSTPRRYVGTGGRVVQIATAGDRIAVREADGSVEVMSTGGRPVRTIAARAGSVAIDASGEIVATTHAREADLWDADSGMLLHRLTGHRGKVNDAEFSPDGKLLVTASDDHDGRIWDVATGRLLHVLRGHFFPVRSASFSPNGRWIVTASQFSGGLWDASSGQLVTYLQGHTAPLTSAAFGPGGEWIATGGDDGTARVYRCVVCTNLPGLVQVARARLSAVH